MKFLIVLFCITVTVGVMGQTQYPEINEEISNGNFTLAQHMIDSVIAVNKLSETEKYDLRFQHDRLDRIRLDFRRTKDDVLAYIRNYIPDADESMLDTWAAEKTLEMMVIDGEKKYFNRAAPNLFRLDPKAKQIKQEKEGTGLSDATKYLHKHLAQVIAEVKETGERYVKPVPMEMTYTLTVDANAVPEGEVIRCWLPFPREDKKRQRDVELISVNDDHYIMSTDDFIHKTVYLEKKAVKDQPTVFEMKYKYTSYAEYVEIDLDKPVAYDTNSELYKKYTSAVPPHVVFSDNIKGLSEKIVGDETHPLKKFKKIFDWISTNIPWAGAREYSTIPQIPEYVIDNMHGDCGQVTLLMITLARYNGIPAKWESGWMTQPLEINLHDWGEIYIPEFGWVPVDQSFGLQSADDEGVKWFYTSGLDSYRLVVNDGYSGSFFPAKIFPRSETVDFQRGEVEWRGGNLYFDKWDYNLDINFPDK